MTKQVLRANQDAANVTAAIALENRTQILSSTQILAATGREFADAARQATHVKEAKGGR
jgi:hypothetical protein